MIGVKNCRMYSSLSSKQSTVGLSVGRRVAVGPCDVGRDVAASVGDDVGDFVAVGAKDEEGAALGLEVCAIVGRGEIVGTGGSVGVAAVGCGVGGLGLGALVGRLILSCDLCHL